MVNSGPRSEVFTTVLVNEHGAVADWTAHRQRLTEHAKRLRIELPDKPPSITAESEQAGWRLARISCAAGDAAWQVQKRSLAFRDEVIDAITVPAPRWNERTNGTKHGDWMAYLTAAEAAANAGCDAALLVHDYAIVDADRGTPMVLDEDGTVWMSPSTDGGVDGITASVLESLLPGAGLPVVRGRLNERTVARCAEMVVVGTGMGVCRINGLDGETIGDSDVLSTTCQRLMSQHFTEESTWSVVGPHDV
jgi:branched-subunit amino acid aminotransferase/4-amino-4-deoxychorismate lyase